MPAVHEVPLERVVRVIARLPDGRQQGGSGYLVARDRVLTAWHCLVDLGTVDWAEPTRAVEVQVRRASDGAVAKVTGVVTVRRSGQGGDSGLDLALLKLADPPWPEPVSPPPRWARVDRSSSGELAGCVAVGYPMYQYQPDQQVPAQTAELRGSIRQADAAQPSPDGGPPRRLQFKDPDLGPVQAPPEAGQATAGSPFGGLSGALVFHRGWALGHVVQHHPRRGDKISLVPIERLAADHSSNARRIAEALHLPPADRLPFDDAPVADLAGLVELLRGEELPRVDTLSAYDVGADRTLHSSGYYVPRTKNGVDERLRDALHAAPGRVVLVVGPSKAGKTRTAFEAVRLACPEAVLARPAPGQLAALVDHPRVAQSRTPLVVWLEDIQRYLTGIGTLTPALLTKLWARPARTVVVATLRSEERALLNAGAEINPSAGQVLADAIEIQLAPTSADPDETETARVAYPDLDLTEYGLAEQLAGAPVLWRRYHDAQYARPEFRAVVETAIDWARIGLNRPIPEQDLRDLARARLDRTHKALDFTDDTLSTAEFEARTPPKDVQGKPTGKVAFLQVADKSEHGRTYQPYPYLVAADDGQRDDPRDIPDWFWTEVLSRTDPVDALPIGVAAYNRHNRNFALTALTRAAESDQPEMASHALYNLGAVLAEMERADEAIGVYDQLITDYRDDPTPPVREQVARALVNKGVILAEDNSPDQAVETYTQVITQYADDPDPTLREAVALALYNKGVALRRHNPALAIDAFSQVTVYSNDPAPRIREIVAKAQYNRGVTLQALGQLTEADDVFVEVIDRYRSDPAREVRDQVELARYRRQTAPTTSHPEAVVPTQPDNLRGG